MSYREREREREREGEKAKGKPGESLKLEEMVTRRQYTGEIIWFHLHM